MKKDELIQIRCSELEKKIIKDKAELLGLSVTDYIINCCCFNAAVGEFINKMFSNKS